MLTALCTALAVMAVLGGVPGPAGRALERRLRTAPDEPTRRPEVRGRRRRRRVVAALAAVAVVVGTGWAFGTRAAVVATAVVWVGLTAIGLVGQRRRGAVARRARTSVAQACAVLASHLRVGQVASEALSLAATDCPVLREGQRVAAIGGDVTRTWRAQATAEGHDGLLDLARAWHVSSETGAPMSATLEQVASSLAADQALRTVVASELAAPRATSKVMAALPALGIGLGYLLGGEPLRWLVAGPFGWACLLGGVGLACLGVLWIETLARQASS